MSFPIGLIYFGAMLGLISIYLFVRERAASSWPTVIAKVVELPPQSMFENFSTGSWILNTDSDHYLIWTVDGKEYRKRLEDKASANISGIKVWRKTPELEGSEIRYDPKKPGNCFVEKEKGVWIWALAFSALSLFSGFIANAT